MADMNLMQAEADALIAMEKHRSTEDWIDFPMAGQSVNLPLQSVDKRERFMLDLSRGQIDLLKVKMQNRGRQLVMLVRLDLGSADTRGSIPQCRRRVGDVRRFSAVLQDHATTAYREGVVHMIQDIQRLMDDYYTWLKDKSVLRQIDQWVEITTPYLDRHNDYIQIYAKQANSGFILTDDGYTIDDLDQSGCKLESPKRQALLKMTLNGFGVQMDGRAIQVHASADNFALSKHNLVQAMLAVNDMFYLAVPMVSSLFYEDVVTWLDVHDIRYTPKVKFTGKTGYDHLFDFVIPKSRQQPERIVQTINRPSKDSAQAVAFSWIDTREVRSSESRAYALLNDSEQPASSAVIDALKSYDVHPIPWGQRHQVREVLAA